MSVWFLLSVVPLTASAQSSGDGYNPDNPIEPSNPATHLMYDLSLTANIPEAGTLTGAGRYMYGTSVTVKETVKSGYKFIRWQKNDEETAYSTSASFTYQVGAENVCFKAIFEKAKSITVKSSDSKAGTVSGSVTTAYNGTSTTVKVTKVNTDYEFLYWLKNDETEPFSSAQSFTYVLNDEDPVTFTAVFQYNEPPYIPENPAEPNLEADKMASYTVNVQLQDEAAGVVSGGGKYQYGKTVTVSTSPNAGYEFRYWQKDDETDHFSENASFSYTVGNADVTFTAVYEHVGIPEPPAPITHKLFLVASEPGSCTFSMASGTEIEVDVPYSVTVTPGTDQDFVGWYINGTLVGSELTYNCSSMGTEDVILTAVCKYNPANPDDPTNSMGYDPGVKIGDVNEDGKVNVSDAVDLIGYYLNNKTSELNASIADVDKNGTINVSDAVEIIDIYLNNK